MLRKAAAAKGVMGTLVQTGVGGAAYFATAKVAPKISFLQGRWWATPAALALVGHLVKRWSPESGSAVCGSAGTLFAMSYYMNAATAPAVAPAKGLGYLGPGEAGSTYGQAGTAGALQLGPGRNSRNYVRAGEAGALIT
jgi:hypothetical protein